MMCIGLLKRNVVNYAHGLFRNIENAPKMRVMSCHKSLMAGKWIYDCGF